MTAFVVFFYNWHFFSLLHNITVGIVATRDHFIINQWMIFSFFLFFFLWWWWVGALCFIGCDSLGIKMQWRAPGWNQARAAVEGSALVHRVHTVPVSHQETWWKKISFHSKMKCWFSSFLSYFIFKFSSLWIVDCWTYNYVTFWL